MQNDNKKPFWGLGILGFNVMLVITYTLLLASAGSEAMLFSAFAIPAHFIVCTTVAIIERDWNWFFAGLITLITGFSTCVLWFSVAGRIG